MTQFLPYAILAGVVVVFFIICYIMFSSPGSSKKKRQRKLEEQQLQNDRAAEWATRKTLGAENKGNSDTAPVPKISNVKVRERQENPHETEYVTTKGEVVRRNGVIVYEDATQKAARPVEHTKDFDSTRVLSRDEVLAAMNKADTKKAPQVDAELEKTAPLTDMAAIVSRDLGKEPKKAAVTYETVVLDHGDAAAIAGAAAAAGTVAAAAVATPAPVRTAPAPADVGMDQTRRMEPIHVDTASMAKKQAKQPEQQREDQGAVSPWGNDLTGQQKKIGNASVWDRQDDNDDPIIQQCVTHFLDRYGVITPMVQMQVQRITVAAFHRVGCVTTSDRERVVASLINQEALQDVQKAYSAHPEDYVASMVLRSFFDVVHCSHTSTRHLVAVDALKVLPYLSRGHFQIVSLLLLFLYSRNSHNVDADAFRDYINKYVIPFMDRFPAERSFFQQLDYLRCTALESKETRFEEILSDSYPLLFRYAGFAEKELSVALHGLKISQSNVVRSFNSQLYKLALVDESMATRFFREAGITDRTVQEHLLRLAKKRPVGFNGEGALDIMEEISPVLADVGDLWDSTLLRVSTLSLLGLYLAQGYVKETIGEEFDLSRWFD